MRPSSADTSEPACTNRKMLSMKKQHVLALVAEVLRHRQAGEADAQARARRLVHLAVDERDAVDHARLLHLEPEVVALAGALADAGEDRHAAVLLGDVVDQLLDQHRLAEAGAAEQADLAAADERRDQVDDLDPGLEDLRLRARARGTPAGRGGSASARRRRAARCLSTGSPRTFQRRPSVTSPTGTLIGAPVSTTSTPRGRPSVESIATARTRSSPEVLLDLGDQVDAAVSVCARDLDRERVVDLRQLAGEDGVDDDALDLDDLAHVLAQPLFDSRRRSSEECLRDAGSTSRLSEGGTRQFH